MQPREAEAHSRFEMISTKEALVRKVVGAALILYVAVKLALYGVDGVSPGGMTASLCAGIMLINMAAKSL